MATTETTVRERLSIVIASSFLLVSLAATFVLYAQLRAENPSSQVLGEKAEVRSCIDVQTVTQALKIGERSVDLYAPQKTHTVLLEPFAGCIQFPSCDVTAACKDQKVSVDKTCVAQTIDTLQLSFNTVSILQRNGVTVRVQNEDWTVNKTNLAAQLTEMIEKEISYCQLTGEEQLPKQKIGSITLAVSDKSASITDGYFARTFVEVDKSKQLIFFWNDGVTQSYPIKQGSSLPKQGVYLSKEVTLAKMLSANDAGYITRNLQQNDYVIIHN